MESSNTALPGLIGVVDRLLLEASSCQNEDKCREYVRTCVVGTLISEALMRLAVSKKKVPVEELFEAVESHVMNSDVLHKYRDFAAEILGRTIKYLEMRGDIKNNMATRDGLMKMAVHIETALLFLGCWTA